MAGLYRRPPGRGSSISVISPSCCSVKRLASGSKLGFTSRMGSESTILPSSVPFSLSMSWSPSTTPFTTSPRTGPSVPGVQALG
jgi:hypothetical protein